MAGSSAGEAGGKIALTLTPCTIEKSGNIKLSYDAALAVLLNPTEFKHSRQISYNARQTLGQVGADVKFAAVNPDSVEFKLTFDGTGAVPPPPGQSLDDVEIQVKKLNDVVYKYNGSQHEPSHVRLLWGTLILFGRLAAMTINYTLFKPSGDPLRAVIDLRFTGFMSNKEAEIRANRSSPDLTHRVVVRQGDTLPLLCDRIYGDPSYYADVARHNRLAAFDPLEPGRALIFPRLG